MQIKVFVLLAFSVMITSGAMAVCSKPECLSGTCTLLDWDLGNCKFVDNKHTSACVNNKCQCGNRSYDCQSLDVVIGECSSDDDCDPGMICDNGDCVYSSVSAGCSENEYGDGLICSQCPEKGKSLAGSSKIQDCYQPEGSIFKDSVGTYTFTDDCYHN